MPELPEVETTARDLREHLVARTILAAAVLWPRTIARPEASEFARAVAGRRIEAVSRRGKFLLLRLKPRATLLVHLRMTGGFDLTAPHQALNRYTRVCFDLDNGRRLCFRDWRKFGRMWLVENEEEVVGGLGPEPLEIGVREFERRIRERRGRLKPLLLDQRFLSGVGNIYADESLWHARLHPIRLAQSLSAEQIARLRRSIRQVLRKGIRRNGTSFDLAYRRVNGESGGYQDEFRVVQRRGQPCYRCRTPIARIVVGQRGTYFCPRCQRPPARRSRR